MSKTAYDECNEWTANKHWRRRPLGRDFDTRDLVLCPKRIIISQHRACHIEGNLISVLKINMLCVLHSLSHYHHEVDTIIILVL